MRVLGIRISTIDLRRRNGAISQIQVVSWDGRACKNDLNEKPSEEICEIDVQVLLRLTPAISILTRCGRYSRSTIRGEVSGELCRLHRAPFCVDS